METVTGTTTDLSFVHRFEPGAGEGAPVLLLSGAADPIVPTENSRRPCVEGLPQQTFRFGPFRVVPASRTLTMNGERRELAGDAFGLLLDLAEARGELATEGRVFANAVARPSGAWQ